MKKNLLATSALIAAGALASQGALAEAKPISINVGGYYEQWVGLIFQDADADNGNRYANALDVQEDGEIHFAGSMTTDNGLTFGVNVQLEAATSGDQIDENYLFVRGSFGEIVLGSENGPAYAMHYGVDIDQGYGLEEGDTAFYWFSDGTENQLNTTRLATIDNDSQKIRWISPRMSGIQVGFSYSPDASQDRDGQVPNEFQNAGLTMEDVFAAGINFDQQFDGMRVRVSATGQYVGDDNGRATGGEDSVWATTLGLRIGAGGFEAAVAWGHHNGQSVVAGDSMDTFAAGISYVDGPMGVSLTGAYGTAESAAGPDANQLVVQLGASYSVGPGVAIRGTAVYASSSDLIAPNVDFTGFGIVGGVALNF